MTLLFISFCVMIAIGAIRMVFDYKKGDNSNKVTKNDPKEDPNKEEG